MIHVVSGKYLSYQSLNWHSLLGACLWLGSPEAHYETQICMNVYWGVLLINTPCWEWKQDWAKGGVKQDSDYNKGTSNPLGNFGAKAAFQWCPRSAGGGADHYSLPPASQRKMTDLRECGVNCGKEAFFGGGDSGGSQWCSHSICRGEVKPCQFSHLQSGANSPSEPHSR